MVARVASFFRRFASPISPFFGLHFSQHVLFLLLERVFPQLIYTMAIQEPIIKKRKLDTPLHKELEAQPSFTEVLEQLEAEEDAAGGEYFSVKLGIAVAN